MYLRYETEQSAHPAGTTSRCQSAPQSPYNVKWDNPARSTLGFGHLISSTSPLREILIIFLLTSISTYILHFLSFWPLLPMASFSSSNGCQKPQIFKHSAKGRREEDVESSTVISSHATELPLRTSLVRDSVKEKKSSHGWTRATEAPISRSKAACHT